MIVGHARLRAALEAELPPQPVLLLGPESTGKWLLARHLGGHHARWYDQWTDPSPGIARVRELRKWLDTRPRGGEVKVALINLDGSKSMAVQNALLKELEEPPGYARFIIVSSRPPLPTIASRCLLYRTGALTTDEVREVLSARGVAPRDAEMAAQAGRGRVGPALRALDNFRPARTAVIGVVRAISQQDRDLLERVVKGWGEQEDWLLRELLAACASGRPTPLFSGTERMLVGRTTARRGIALLAAAGRARPQTAVRVLASALMADRRLQVTVPVPNPTQEELDEARVMMERLRAENNGRHAAIRQLGADIAPGFYSSIKIDAFIQFIFARMGNVTPEIRQLLTYQFEISFEQEVAAKLNEMKGEIRKAMLAAPMGMPNGNHTPPSPDGGLWRPGQ